MSSENRGIVLRNDDPSITYIGKWTSVQADTVINFGTFGPALSPTLHTTVSNGSFSLPFYGSSINVLGTINITNSSSTNPNPTWACSIDDLSLGPPNLSDAVKNHWVLCNHSFLDGAHELTVNVTSDGMPFYLDYVEYRASPNVSLENALILIDNPDPAIDYGSGWGSLGGVANQTTDPSTKGLVNITFVGIQLFWYGFIPTEEPHNASSGAYSIDGGLFSSFQLHGLPSTATTVYNQLFFTTPILDMRTHVLSVKYTGMPWQTPLSLDYLYVMNGSFPSSSLTSGGTETSSSNPTSSDNHASNPTSSDTAGLSSGGDKRSSVGPIVGGVMGSIIGVAIIIFLVGFKCYRRRGQGKPPHEIMPFLHQPTSTPPLQTNQIPKDPTQHEGADTNTPMPNESLNSTPTNQASSYTINPAPPQARSSLPPRTSIPSGNLLSPPVTPVHALNTALRESRILLQHEDSGLRLRLPAAVEEVEVPPIYTEN